MLTKQITFDNFLPKIGASLVDQRRLELW